MTYIIFSLLILITGIAFYHLGWFKGNMIRNNHLYMDREKFRELYEKEILRRNRLTKIIKEIYHDNKELKELRDIMLKQLIARSKNSFYLNNIRRN